MVCHGWFLSVPLVAQNQQPSAGMFFLPWLLILAIFYLMLIRPAQRQRKKMSELLVNLKAGDKVITSGGIYGTIVGLDGDTVQLRIADQVRVKVMRSAITGLQPESKES
jgi:preprotein translocase subunit YajC